MKNQSVKKNYVYNLAYTILNMLLPLVTAPYLARVLGTEGVGIYAYNFAIAQFFVLIAKLGLVNYGTRELSKVEKKEDKSILFSNLFYLQIIATVFSTLVYAIYMILFSENNINISIIFSFWILFSFLDVDWLWFAEEEFKKISIRNITVKIITLICIFIFVKTSNDIYLYTIIMVLGYILGYASIWIGIKKKIDFKKIDFKIFKKNIKPCLIMLIPVLSLTIYRSMDKVMIGIISGMDETGIYENGEKLIYCLSSLISSLGTVMLPRLSYLTQKKDKKEIKKYIETSLKFIIMLTSALSLGLIAISKSLIIVLFGIEFEKSNLILSLCAPTLIFIGWSNVFRTQYIIPNKLDDIYVKSISYGSVINLLLNFIFIPKLNSIGATIGTIGAELFVPFYQYLRLRNKINYKECIKNTIFYPIYAIIMMIIVYFIGNLINNVYIKLIIQIISGMVIYIGGCYMYLIKYDKEFLKNIGLTKIINKTKQKKA